MTASLSTLRERLATRERTLADVQSRLKVAKARPKPSVKPSISDIQRRYLSAVASLDDKERTAPRPYVRASGDGVSSLASRWDEGMHGKAVEKTRVQLRGDVNAAKKNFAAGGAPLAPSARRASKPKANEPPAPAQLLVDDDAGVPSWAVNQRRLVLRKENARSSIRDVDVRELQGSVLSEAARDGSEAPREHVAAKGNVKAALAMWGRTADDDARVLEEQRRREEEKAAEAERLRLEAEAERARRQVEEAVRKFANLRLQDMPKEEPDDHVELVAFLERKIVLIEKEIQIAEKELEKLEAN